jgi:sulfite reductase alpha subunit-like flavoprotein
LCHQLAFCAVFSSKHPCIIQRLGLDVPVLAMDDFDMRMLPSLSRVVFFVSTTGQGGAPDNMKKSWNILLRKELPFNSLSAVHVAVFGLGDSSYSKFNFPSKKLHARLLQLGAQPMLPLGIGDDQHIAGPYTALVPWQAALIKILAVAAAAEGVQIHERPLSVVANYSLRPVAPAFSAGIHSTSFTRRSVNLTTFTVLSTAATKALVSAADTLSSSGEMSLLKVIDNQVLSRGDGREVRHIEFDWSGGVYNPGDVLFVQPKMPELDRCTFFA